MASNKVISVTAAIPQADISSGEKAVAAEVPLLSAGIVNPEVTTSIDTDVELTTNLSNYGEDRGFDSGLFKFLEDAKTAFDTVVLKLIKNALLIDSIKLSDSIFIALTKREILTDKVIPLEEFSRSFNKVLNDTSLTSDIVTFIKSTSINFTDIIRPTDDFYGEANLDDDQTVSFIKILLEYSLASDTTFARIGKRFVDSSIVSENNYKLLGKNLQESLNTAEIINRLFSKYLEDSSLISDAVSTYYNKSEVEQKIVSDDATLQFNKLEPNLVVTTEIFSRIFLKQLNDIISITDVIDLNYGEEEVGQLLESLQIVEYNLINFSKVLTDTEITTDSRSLLFNKVLTDTTAIYDYIIDLNFNSSGNIDNLNIVESYLKQLSKVLTEVLNINESLSINTNKYLTDSLINSEIVLTEFQKVQLENIAPTENRIAHKQDYMSNNYVSLDYFGTFYTI
jgi:hypothetical protein